MTLRSKLYLLLVLTALILPLPALIVQVGEGLVEDQGLPWSVTTRYSYVQQVYPAAAIGVSGSISSIAFQYNVGSNVYFEANRDLRIFMGHSSSASINAWLPFEELTEVYSGLLEPEDYSSGVPGTGWLTIVLQTPFSYNNDFHLLIGIDENSSGYGAVIDDFYCTPQPVNRSLRFRSMSINPSPENPPTENLTALAYLANLRLEIGGAFYNPYAPTPTHQAVEVEPGTLLTWLSDATTFDIKLGTDPGDLPLVATAINQCQWQPQQPLDEATSYYWQVIASHNSEIYPSAVWSFSTVGSPISEPRDLSAEMEGNSVRLNWAPPISGLAAHYQIWRNGASLGTSTYGSYRDQQISSNTLYTYKVRAVSPSGVESGFSPEVQIQVPQLDPTLIMREGFEIYPAFSAPTAPWQVLDLDASLTWGWEDLDFPGEGSAMGWIVFAPTQTVPPLSGVTAYTGSKMLCSVSSLSPPSSDWLISNLYYLGSGPSLSFYARSHTSIYGLERLRVLISTGSADPADFVPISPEPYLQVPAAWTQYSYNLSEYQNQTVRLAFHATSWDAFALYLDDIELRGIGGSPNQDEIASAPSFKLYPNPCGGDFKLIWEDYREPFVVSIYDLRGRRLFRETRQRSFESVDAGLNLASGLYFIRLESVEGRLLESLKLVIYR